MEHIISVKPDLVISGIGQASGGQYNDAKIEGMARVSGDLECSDMLVNGTMRASGNITSQSLSIQGMSNIAGKLEAARIHIEGTIKIGGRVAFATMNVQGTIQSKRSMNGEEIRLEGLLKTGGDCEAERFIARGGFKIAGLLNAGQIDIRLFGGSSAQEIGGETIEIRREAQGNFLHRLFSYIYHSFSNTLNVDTIEGDDIYLEYTRARTVRGNNVTIGPGCRIDKVEYKNKFHRDSKARVGSSKKA